MKIKLKNSLFVKTKSVKRIAYAERSIGNIDVFYAFYKAETEAGVVYAVAVGEDDTLSAVTFGSIKKSFELYKLVTENNVGEVSFFDVAEDYFHERFKTICCELF